MTTRQPPATGTGAVQITTIAIIGAGRLGSALAVALAASPLYHVDALVARRAANARRVARLLNSSPSALGVANLAALPDAQLVFITTPDDQIAVTAARLADALPINTPILNQQARSRQRIALHASGALASDALEPLRARGFALGSMHPLAAISSGDAGAANLRGAFYCVEGDAAAVRAARRVVRSLGGHSFTIAPRDKALYHAAAVLTSGHLVALFDLAIDLLARCGLERARARLVLLPLLRTTLDNLAAHADPARALTGTFARADVATVRRHLAALRETPGTAEALAAYLTLGQHSVGLAARHGADPDALRDIAAALETSKNEL